MTCGPLRTWFLVDIYVSNVQLFHCSKFVNLARVTRVVPGILICGYHLFQPAKLYLNIQ